MKDYLLSAEFRQIAELVYFFSAPVLVLIGLFGLGQLWVAKKTLKINSLRDASKLSIELIQKLNKDFLGYYIEICRALKKNKLEQSSGLFEFTKEGYEKIPKEKRDEFDKNIQLANNPLSKLSEELEAFSVPLINGIADEKIAYNSIGGRFCITMGFCYPFIMKIRLRENSDIPFSESIKLYNIWYPRLKNQLTKEKIECLQNEMADETENQTKIVGT